MKISHHFAVYLKYCKPTVCVCLYVLNNIWLSFDPQTAVHEAPQYMRFPRQENWSGLLFLQSKRNENLTVLATATHIPDRVTGPLEGAGAGSWSLRIVHQSQGKKLNPPLLHWQVYSLPPAPPGKTKPKLITLKWNSLNSAISEHGMLCVPPPPPFWGQWYSLSSSFQSALNCWARGEKTGRGFLLSA